MPSSRARTRPTVGAALAVLVAVVFAIGWNTQVASANSFGGFIGGATGTSAGPGGLFNQPRDVAVYEGTDGIAATDKIFVVEGLNTNQRIQRLDVDGNFERMWGRDVIATAAPGDTGSGYEICVVATDCQASSNATGSAGGEFSAAQGVAVNQATGHVYVLDRDNRRVQEFNLDGQFVRAWGWDVVQTGGTGDDAVAPINELEVCTVASECKAGTAGAGDGQFSVGTPANGVGIAIDPANGDVFAADPGSGATGNRRIMQFSSAGAFVAQFGGLGAAATFAAGQPLRIAVDANHVVYGSDTNANGRVNRYDSVADVFMAPIAVPPLLNGGTGAGSTSGLEVDQISGNLLVMRDPSAGDTVVQELQSPGAAVPPAAVFTTHMAGSPLGTVNGLGYNSSSKNIYVPVALSATAFPACGICAGLIVSAPAVGGDVSATVAPASAVASQSAVVNGTIDPNGVASYHFEMSRDGAWGSDSSVGREEYLSGSDDVAVSQAVSGLEPNTLYRVRIVVKKYASFASTTSVTSDENLVLTDAAAPEVVTQGSANRTATGAQLRGLVDPNGSSTSYRFEYGPAGQGFGQRVPVPDAPAGSGNTPELVVRDVDGLQPATAYQYRVVATNDVGTSTGAPVAFTTRAVTDADPAHARAVELVSPARKQAGVGAGLWGSSALTISATVGTAAYDGDRFATAGGAGSMLLDAPFAFANDWAFGERGANGWEHHTVATRGGYGPETYRFLQMRQSTGDFSRMMWNSNSGTINFFAEQGSWPDNINPVGLSDWLGSWELVAPTDPAQGGLSEPADVGGTALSADGKHAVLSGGIRGVAGPADPTLDLPSSTRTTYVDEVSGPVSDSFPGSGSRKAVGACTSGTLIPRRLASGKQDAQPCPPPVEYAPGQFRDGSLISVRGDSIGAAADNTTRIVSADGSRVFFTSPDPYRTPTIPACSGTDAATLCPPQLYVRQRNGEGSVSTRWISKPEVPGQDASLLGPARFEGASSDGDKVFFRSPSPLTADDRNGGASAPVTTGALSGTSWDLYMYDLPDGPSADPAGGDLVRISSGPNGTGDCNVTRDGNNSSQPTAGLRFLSSDGSSAYFTCAAPLPGVPTHANGTITSPSGSPGTTATTNLYAYDSQEPLADRWRFVAQLPQASPLGNCATAARRQGPAIATNGTAEHAEISAQANCVRGNSDGTFVTFWTDGRLSLDDPDASSGDIYAYDADAETLTRVTAPQGGVGGDYSCVGEAGGPRCNGDPGLGDTALPLPALGVATDPAVSDDRIAFFQSRSRLVTTDIDDEYDVYEWRNGSLALISTGNSPGNGVFYTGNDRSGRNVYMASQNRLTWEDVDDVMDVYVARTGGGFDPPPPPPICQVLAGACQGPGLAPDAFPVDSNQAGGGNSDPSPRIEVSIKGLSKRARRRAAKSGVVKLTVTISRPCPLRVTATSRIAGKERRVSSATARPKQAGPNLLKLLLNRIAMHRLMTRKSLPVRFTARCGGSHAATIGTTLKRGNR